MDNYVVLYIFIVAFITHSSSLQPTSNTFRHLLPDETKIYTYSFLINASSSIKTPTADGSYWTVKGKLYAQTFDESGWVRFRLDDLKSTVISKKTNSTEQLDLHVDLLKKPWEVGVCFNEMYTDTEPVWVTNMKRAVSFNFLFTEPKNSLSTYHGDEPCIHGNCIVVYSPMGTKTRKYYSLIDFKRSRPSTYEQNCLPNISPESWYRPSYSEDTSNVMTAERLFDVDKESGLRSVELRSDYQYRTRDNVLSVATYLTLHLEGTSPASSVEKQNLTKTHMHYVSQSHGDPNNGIWNPTQEQLKDTTLKNLLQIAKKGIDTDNIVRNASLIHNLDFVELLNTMSQLNFDSLKKLFEDVLGTSYELETSRNIFLEILPYVRTEATAKLIRYLVTEQKTKIEDAMLLSLIRKLPYSVIEYRKSLLEELEVFTKLGPDFPKEIQNAGILSFATLVHKTMEVAFDQQYFDDVYDKYMRMYNNCPQYADRLVWLQGLTNIGKSVVNYLDEIHTDNTKDRHERLWAALASLSIWRRSSLENTLPILMNATEHIQLRVMALHGFLSSPMGARDLMNVNNYITNCDNDQLKKFWFSTVKNLERNRFYHKYKSASYYIPFVASQVHNPGPQHWATNNYIVSEELPLDIQGPTFQLMTVGGPWNGPPEMVLAEFNTGAENTFNANIYIISEGLTENIFKRILNLNNLPDENFDSIKEDLRKLNAKHVEHKKLHIDIIVKVQDKTIYATHIDESKFDGWNADEIRKSLEDFVRFGSHINQQMVYYPIQTVKHFGTEIGTPIRFQSTIVSFTSIRGNLTAPFTDEMTWRNDLHLRYQGTSLTSLSTDGPLAVTEHSTKIQQSMVVHLPVKLDLSVYPNERSAELLWTNPSQSGGVAMHSRTQVGVKSLDGNEVYTVEAKNLKKDRDFGIFFDCDRPLSVPEISQLFVTRRYNLLTSLQPSQFILNSIRLITSPASGSCGLILPPRQLQTGNKVKFEAKLDEFTWSWEHVNLVRYMSGADAKKKVEDNSTKGGNNEKENDENGDIGVKAKASYALSYYRDAEDNVTNTYLILKGTAAVESDSNEIGVNIDVNSHQPELGSDKDWSICFEEKQTSLESTILMDFRNTSTTQEGSLNIAFASDVNSSCINPSSKLSVKFKSIVEDQRRIVDARVWSVNIPKLDLASSNLVGQSDVLDLLRRLGDLSSDDNETPSSLVIKEENGVTSVSIDGEDDVELRSAVLSWLPSSSNVLQALKKYGFYHQCTIKGPFHGRNGKLEAWYEETLLLGDCTEEPRFAITSPYPDFFTFSTGKDSVYVTGKSLVGNDLKLTIQGNSTMVTSSRTGVIVVVNTTKHLYKEIVILVPQPLMNTACGVCVDRRFIL